MPRSDERVREQNPYAPPRTVERDALEPRAYSRAVALLASGITLSVIWAVYVSLHTRGAIGTDSLLRIAVTIGLWLVPFAFLLRGAGWARRACRVLAVITVAGSVESVFVTSGSAWFHAMGCLRALLFMLAYFHLPPPPAHLPS